MPELIAKAAKAVQRFLVGYDRAKVNDKHDDQLIQNIQEHIDDDDFRKQLEDDFRSQFK